MVEKPAEPVPDGPGGPGSVSGFNKMSSEEQLKGFQWGVCGFTCISGRLPWLEWRMDRTGAGERAGSPRGDRRGRSWGRDKLGG